MKFLADDDRYGTVLHLAESLDSWLLLGFRHRRSVFFLASQHQADGALGPVTSAVIEPSVYDPLVAMSLVYLAELEGAAGPGYGPFPAGRQLAVPEDLGDGETGETGDSKGTVTSRSLVPSPCSPARSRNQSRLMSSPQRGLPVPAIGDQPDAKVTQTPRMPDPGEE